MIVSMSMVLEGCQLLAKLGSEWGTAVTGTPLALTDMKQRHQHANGHAFLELTYCWSEQKSNFSGA